ncbi:MAG TPA: AMP-binding protein [Streptosporangiaceae bacterium]|nr:AMP-binding protein [Streptosporangiaceae bacterium]
MDPVETEALTIPAAVARAAREFGEAEALAVPAGEDGQGGWRLSYRELAGQVEGVSAALIAAGIEAGDRVALWAPNGGEWLLAALGALSAGAALVPVSTRFTGPEALDVIVRSGARALFVAGNFLGVDRLGALRAAAAAGDATAGDVTAGDATAGDATAGDATAGDATAGDATAGDATAGDAASDTGTSPGGGLGRLALVVRIPEEWEEFTGRGTAVAAGIVRERAEAVSPGDVSDIMFTSGTTGRSKGAMTSHERSLAVARAWAECGEVTRGDRYLVANPFFHTFGYKAGILACLVSGAALVPQPVFDAGEAMRLVAAERITVLPGAPTIYQMILDHPERGALDLSSLRLAVTGAADVPVALIERMRRELSFETVLTAYGLTEAVVATMCRPGDAPEVISGTSGRAAAGFEVRIGPSEEILLRGPNMMLGYLDDPKATAAAIDAQGWLHTGDAGRLDEAGNLTITGRLKDMYICGGFNVYPAEVEQVLARLDGVADAAVVGMPDPRLGEVGRAFVVPRAGFALAEEDVLAFCRERLANYKVPRRVEFRGELPRNPSGKVLKRILKEEP